MNKTAAPSVDINAISQRLHDLALQLLAKAKQQGASAAEVVASSSAGFSLNVRMGEVETLEYAQDQGIGLSVYFGQCKGSASTSDTSSQSLDETVAAACAIAQMMAADPCAGLADYDRMAWQDGARDLDLYHPWQLEPAQAIALALDCEQHARNSDARITNSEGVSLSTGESAHVYANSHGFVGVVPTTRHSISCSLLATQAADTQAMQRDHYYSVARAVTGLCSWQELAEKAVARTVRRLGARPLPTCQVPVIFEAPVASSLLRSFLGAISGGNLYRKSSFLLDQLDQLVFAPHVTIQQKPHLPRALGSAAFDGEGVSTTDITFVQQGVLRSYLLGSYSARKLGLHSTGNAGGAFNLSINSGASDLAGLLRQMQRGLLVTELMGQGVNLVTGDYSRGAMGFWVENGMIQYPVEQITIAGNLRDIFRQILAVGNDVDTRGTIHSGSILVERMTVAGC